MWSRIALFSVVVVPAVAVQAVRAPSAGLPPGVSMQRPALDTRAAFLQLERLIGTWSSVERGRGGRPSSTTFKRTGGGKTIVNDAGGMLTIYHPDGANLMLTHYCGAGNQPRMRLDGFDGRTLSFTMFDITNLATPRSYHTTRVELTFMSNDKVTLSYIGTADGQESSQVFELTRQN